MKKHEIFAEILSAVSLETDIPRERIISKAKDEETVDARHLLIYLLNLSGFYTDNTASMLKISKRAVTRALSGFSDRLSISPMLRINLAHLKTLLPLNK